MKNRFLLVMVGVAVTPICWATDALDIGTGNTVNAGSNSIAAGTGNEVDNESIAIGNLNIVWGAEGSAFGEYNEIGGWANSGVGWSNQTDAASGSSIMLGGINESINSVSVVLAGEANTIENEEGSFIAGLGNFIQASSDKWGMGNILLGAGNQMYKNGVRSGGEISIESSVLIGVGNETTETRAWAMGMGNLAQTDTVTLGTYAQQVSAASLIVGNGEYDARSNALVVLKNGTVSIPSGTLLLNGQSALTSESGESLISSYLGAHSYFSREHGIDASATGGSLAAWGWEASASGNSAFAIGIAANASGEDSFALGHSASASGDWGMALGFVTEATGTHAVAIGSLSLAEGDYSVALGRNSEASGMFGVALAGGNSSGDCSFSSTYGMATGYLAIGMGTGTASGASSIALGGFDDITAQANEASGAGATAIGGSSNIALGNNTFVTGYQTKAAVAGSVAMGSHNLTRGDLLPFLNSTDWNETEALFELGNGDPGASPAEYSNAITTLKNGRTRLTNKFWNSSAPKDVPSNATEASNGEALVVEGHTVLKGNTQLAGKVTLLEAQGDISMGIYGD